MASIPNTLAWVHKKMVLSKSGTNKFLFYIYCAIICYMSFFLSCATWGNNMCIFAHFYNFWCVSRLGKKKREAEETPQFYMHQDPIRLVWYVELFCGCIYVVSLLLLVQGKLQNFIYWWNQASKQKSNTKVVIWLKEFLVLIEMIGCLGFLEVVVPLFHVAFFPSSSHEFLMFCTWIVLLGRS